MNTRLTLIAATALLAGCASTPSPEQQAKLADESRATVMELIKKTAGTLQQELGANGPEAAIVVCREKAPQIARGIMEEKKVQVRRVTTKQRNPRSAPDAWETKVLQDFEARLAKGEKPDSVEHYQVVNEDGKPIFRYMKALPTLPLCMTCHGASEYIPAGVQAKLKELYPHDQATGYSVGMLRGAVSLKKPL